MTTELVRDYLDAIQSALMLGNATEHTYRAAFQTLLGRLGGRDITVTNEPKRKKYGAPDLEYCSAFGDTTEDAVRELGVAMQAWLASARDNNIPIPPPPLTADG